MRLSHLLAICVVTAGTTFAVAPLTVHANEPQQDAIESFKLEDVALFDDNLDEIASVKSKELGSLPIPILGEHPNGYVKIVYKGNQVWVDRFDINVRNKLGIKQMCAQDIKADPSDRKTPTSKGIEKCN